MSIRECDRCTAITAGGTRCKMRTCTTGPYCWIHTKSISGLQVKESGIPNAGLGLYTTRDRKKGDKMPIYTGERKTQKQVDAMQNTDYVFKVKKDLYIDAAKTNSGPARYINHCRSIDEKKNVCKNNAKFYRVMGDQISLKTKKRLKEGDEIFASYGRTYWSKEKKKYIKPKKKRKNEL